MIDKNIDIYKNIYDDRIQSDEQLIVEFFNFRTRKGSKANKTLQGYALDIAEFKNYVNELTGQKHFPFRQVTSTMCNMYIDWLEREEVITQQNGTILKKPVYASSTISRRVKTIKSLFSFGMRRKYFDNNPWEWIDTPKANPTGKKTFRILTLDEIERIQAVAKASLKTNAIISWFLSTGCRREELVRAKWKDLRLEETKSKGTRVVWHVFGKGSKEDDLVIHNNTLEKVIAYRKEAGLPYEIGIDSDTPIFCSDFHLKRNKPEALSLSGINYLIKSIGLQAGVPNLSPHWFRHSTATYALLDGADIYKVKQQLRHSDLRTTEMYLHELEKFEETAVDSIKRIKF